MHVPGRASTFLVVEKCGSPQQARAYCAYIPLLCKIKKADWDLAGENVPHVFRIQALENCSQPAENLEAWFS